MNVSLPVRIRELDQTIAGLHEENALAENQIQEHRQRIVRLNAQIPTGLQIAGKQLEALQKSQLAKTLTIAFLVTGVALIVLAIVAAVLLNPFCGLIAVAGVVFLISLIAPAMQAKAARNLTNEARELEEEQAHIRLETHRIAQRVVDQEEQRRMRQCQIAERQDALEVLQVQLHQEKEAEYAANYSNPQLITFFIQLVLGDRSFQSYFNLPENIREFVKKYPDHKPYPCSAPIPYHHLSPGTFTAILCPLTQKWIRHPVKDPVRGYIYEREAAFAWYERHGSYPFGAEHLYEMTDLGNEIENSLADRGLLGLRSRWPKPPDGAKAWRDEELLAARCLFIDDSPVAPVEDLTTDGKTLYSRAEILQWRQRNDTSPQTRKPLVDEQRNDQIRERPDLAARLSELRRNRLLEEEYKAALAHPRLKGLIESLNLDYNTLNRDTYFGLLVPEHIRAFIKKYPNSRDSYLPSDPIPKKLFLNRNCTFLCPLTGDRIRHPVRDKAGCVYEKEAVFAWYKQHGSYPFEAKALYEMPNEETLIEAALALAEVRRRASGIPKPPQGARVWRDDELLEAEECPISLELLTDPVEDLTTDGKILYEKPGITNEEGVIWLKNSAASQAPLIDDQGHSLLRERPDLKVRLALLKRKAEAEKPSNSQAPNEPSSKKSPKDKKKSARRNWFAGFFRRG